VRFCRKFAPWFRPLAQLGLGFFLPPPYLADRIAERPGLTRRLEGLEERWGRRWPAPLIADHFLVVLERK
jgi:hypothetical protein